MIIFRKFTFDSAHYLPNVPENHKCRQMHGHTYKLTIFIEGMPDKEYGWIIDFALVKKAVEPIIQVVDHKLLNDIPGLENPERAWLVVAMSSTLAGNFTLLGSVANLIVAEQAKTAGTELSFGAFFKVGLPLTLITLVAGTAWLAFAF